METHGKNTQKEVIAIIPARYSSERLPGKLLLEAGGKPVIVHTMERVRLAQTVTRVIVAVDHEEMMAAVVAAGGEAVMTSPTHESGSDRVAEVALGFEGDPIIVNVQGDEPQISPDLIDRAVIALEEDALADMTTAWEPIEDPAEVVSADTVKVVLDQDGYALYFSRAPMPFPRDEVREFGSIEAALENVPELLQRYKKHTGLYVFRRDSLVGFTSFEPTSLEVAERLEQLRALEHGFLIRVVESDGKSIGIDTAEDLEKFRSSLQDVAV